MVNQGKCDGDMRVHLPTEAKLELRRLAQSEGRTLSAYARRVLVMHATVEVTRKKLEGTIRDT